MFNSSLGWSYAPVDMHLFIGSTDFNEKLSVTALNKKVYDYINEKELLDGKIVKMDAVLKRVLHLYNTDTFSYSLLQDQILHILDNVLYNSLLREYQHIWDFTDYMQMEHGEVRLLDFMSLTAVYPYDWYDYDENGIEDVIIGDLMVKKHFDVRVCYWRYERPIAEIGRAHV